MSIKVAINPPPDYLIKIQRGQSNLETTTEYLVSPTSDVAVTATEPLGAYRAVEIGGVLCNLTIESFARYAGITRVATPTGETTYVAKEGLITEPGWNWTVDQPIFIGANGTLTQTPPPAPIRRIGWAISTTQINLDPFPTIGV